MTQNILKYGNKSRNNKGKVLKSELHQNSKLLTLKTIINRVKRQSRVGENICKSYI
jgi:hypothetical protein